MPFRWISTSRLHIVLGVVSVAALIVAGAPSPASAAGRLVRVGAVVNALVSDGERFAAWQRGDVLTVFDARTGARKTYPVNAGCFPSDLASGTVLFACGSSGATLDLRSGARRGLPAPAVDPGLTGTATTFAQLGRQWIRVRVTEYHTGYDVYVKRDDPGAAALRVDALDSQTVDLDSPGLVRNLCAPVRATSWISPDSGLSLERAPFAYAPPYAAGPSQSDGVDPRSRLLLWRCGHRAQVLDRCAVVPQLGGGWISWSCDRRVSSQRPETRIRVRRLSGGRTLDWVLPDGSVRVVHVRGRLFAADGGSLFTAPLRKTSRPPTRRRSRSSP